MNPQRTPVVRVKEYFARNWESYLLSIMLVLVFTTLFSIVFWWI